MRQQEKAFRRVVRAARRGHRRRVRPFRHRRRLYRRYVEAKPRYGGVTAFLETRGIELPFGTSEDATDAQTMRALGKLCAAVRNAVRVGNSHDQAFFAFEINNAFHRLLLTTNKPIIFAFMV